jgi:hypothetical protein
MKVHTGSFWGPYPQGALRICVATGIPAGFFRISTLDIPNYQEQLRSGKALVGAPFLYPGWSLVQEYNSRAIGPEKYTEKYMQALCEQVPEGKTVQDFLINELKTLSDASKQNELVLCCWEPPYKFCHRFLLYDLLPDELKGKRQ